MVLEPSSCFVWLPKVRMSLLSMAALGLAVAIPAMVLAPQPARANCYEGIGCTHKDYFKPWQLKKLSCQILWEMRNWIYKENGYCFHSTKAIEAFGNAGCDYDDAAQVPLNAVERHNVSAIKKVEHKKGCL